MYDLIFYDYNHFDGIKCDDFVKKELGGIRRFEIYVPMITEACFSLDCLLLNDLTVRQTINLIRFGKKGLNGASQN